MLALQQPYKPSPVLDASASTSDSEVKDIRFVVSAKHIVGKWKYRAVAFNVQTGMELVEERMGSAQVRMLKAVLLAVREKAKTILLILMQSELVPVVVLMENISLAGKWKRGVAEGRLEVSICTGSNPTNPHRMDQSSCQWSRFPGQPRDVPTHQGQATPTGIVPMTLMDT